MWDQNKSFLSIRSAESNRRRTWFSAPVWYLGEAIASQEQNGILISGRIEFWFCVYFLFQILSVSCLEILCAWVTSRINFLGKKLWSHKLTQNPPFSVLKALSFGEGKCLGWDFWVKFPFSFTRVLQQWGSFSCQVGRKRAWTSLWVKSCIPGACM